MKIRIKSLILGIETNKVADALLYGWPVVYAEESKNRPSGGPYLGEWLMEKVKQGDLNALVALCRYLVKDCRKREAYFRQFYKGISFKINAISNYCNMGLYDPNNDFFRDEDGEDPTNGDYIPTLEACAISRSLGGEIEITSKGIYLNQELVEYEFLEERK